MYREILERSTRCFHGDGAGSLGVRGPYRTALSLWLVFIYVKSNIVDWFCLNDACSTAQRRTRETGQMHSVRPRGEALLHVLDRAIHDSSPNFHPRT